VISCVSSKGVRGLVEVEPVVGKLKKRKRILTNKYSIKSTWWR